MASAGNSSSNVRNINLIGAGKKDDNNTNENKTNNTNNTNSNETSNTNNTNSNETSNTNNTTNVEVEEADVEPMENISRNTSGNESFIPLEPVSGNMNTNTNKSKFNRLSNFTMKNKGNGNHNNGNGPKMTVESLTKVCEEMMTHHIVMKMFHFQTDSYAAHKASDTYITAFLAFHDMFMETAQGIYGKMSCEKHNCTTMLFSSTSDCIKHLDEYRMKMKELRTRVSDQSDLVNMVDDQLQSINQLKYLLSFK
jgi:hypothetical protein